MMRAATGWPELRTSHTLPPPSSDTRCVGCVTAMTSETKNIRTDGQGSADSVFRSGRGRLNAEEPAASGRIQDGCREQHGTLSCCPRESPVAGRTLGAN